MYQLKLFLLFLCLAVTKLSATELPRVSQGRIERLSNFNSQYVPSRHIDIWLPEGYPAQQPYQTLYMHDGQMLFDANNTWNNQEWRVDEVASELHQQNKVTPFIVVGIWNSGNNRHSEYFPQKPFLSLTQKAQKQAYQLERNPKAPLFVSKVYSDKYLKFITAELIPHIEQNYAVGQSAKNRFLAGSSMGGLISWYGLMEYPQTFAGAASISTHWPGAVLDNNPIPSQFNQYIQQRLKHLSGHKLYFDYGDKTLDALYPPLQRKVDTLFDQYPRHLWQSLYFKGEAHNEKAWAKRLDKPLTFLFSKSDNSQGR